MADDQQPPPGYDVVDTAPPPGYDVVDTPAPVADDKPPAGYDVVDTEPTPPPKVEQPSPSTDQPTAGEVGGAAMLGNVLMPGGAVPAAVYALLRHQGVLDAAVSGIKESLAPFNLTKEELKGHKSGIEEAAQLGSRLGTDIALPAAGAAIGTAVLPGLGTAAGAAVGEGLNIAMGVYRGVGYEYSMAKAEGRDFDIKKAAVNSATEAVPFIKQGGKLIHAVMMGAGVAERVRQYQEPGASGSTPVLAGLGAMALTAVLRHAPPAVARDVDEATAAESSARPSPLGGEPGIPPAVQDIRTAAATSADTLGNESRINALMDEIPKDQRATPTELDRVPEEFWDSQLPKALKGTDRQEAKAEYWRKSRGVNEDTGLTEVDADWSRWWREQAVGIVAGENAERQAGEVLGGANPEDVAKRYADPLRFKVLSYFGRVNTIVDLIDSKLGTSFGTIIRGVNGAKQDMITASQPFYDRAANLVKQGAKAGLKRTAVGEAIQDSAVYDGLSADSKLVVDSWRDLFGDVRTFMQSKGLTIGDLGEGYLTQVQLDRPSRADAIRRAYQSFKQEAKNGELFGGVVDAETGAVNHTLEGATATVNGKALNFMDFKRAVAHELNITPAEVQTEQQVADALVQITNPQAKFKGGGGPGPREASATFEREGVIPAFIQETDVGRVFSSYINGNFKSIYFNPWMKALDAHIPLLEGMGWKNSTESLQQYARNMAGEEGAFKAWINTKIDTYKAGIKARIGDDLTAEQGATRQLIPDFLSWASGLVYHNYLGWNFRSAVRHTVQPTFMTAPEIGGLYGYALTARAYMAAALGKHAGNPVVDLGLGTLGGHGSRQALAANSVFDAGALGKVAELADKTGAWGMKLMEKAIEINRLVVYHTGQEWAKDIAAGNATALKALKAAPVSVRAEIEQLVSGGQVDRKAIGDSLAKWLNEKTQFNYTKEDQSQFARDFGPIFSAFTTWPSMVGGDMYKLLNDRNFQKFAHKYVAPWVALTAADLWLKDTEGNPVARLMVGKSLASNHPADAVLGFQGLENAPLFQAGKGVYHTLTSALEADWTNESDQAAGKVALGVGGAVAGFAPFGFAFNRAHQVYSAFNPEKSK